MLVEKVCTMHEKLSVRATRLGGGELEPVRTGQRMAANQQSLEVTRLAAAVVVVCGRFCAGRLLERPAHTSWGMVQ